MGSRSHPGLLNLTRGHLYQMSEVGRCGPIGNGVDYCKLEVHARAGGSRCCSAPSIVTHRQCGFGFAM